MFANEHAGVGPDLLCLSKGISGGYLPLSAVLSTEEIYQAFYDDYPTMKAFLHSHSYTGNVLACALAVEVQKIFAEEDILAQLPAKMAQFDAAATPLYRRWTTCRRIPALRHGSGNRTGTG